MRSERERERRAGQCSVVDCVSVNLNTLYSSLPNNRPGSNNHPERTFSVIFVTKKRFEYNFIALNTLLSVPLQ